MDGTRTVMEPFRAGAWTALALLAAALALPPAGLWPAAPLAWLALLHALAGCARPLHAAALGALFCGGIAAHAFLGALSYGPAAYAGGVTLLAVLGAAFGAWAGRALTMPHTPLRAALAVAGAWTLLELVAVHGFGVPFLAAATLDGLEAPPTLLRWGGPHAVGFVLAALPAWAVAGHRARRGSAATLAVLATGGIALLLLPPGPSVPEGADGGDLKVAVVQTTLPGWRFREPGLAGARRRYTEAIAAAARRAASGAPDLVVWPELGYAGYPFRVQGSLARHLPRGTAHLITVPDLDPAGRERLAAFLVDAEGQVRAVQGKSQLVPWIERAGPASAAAAPLLVEGLRRPGVLICLEGTLPHRVRALARAGAGWLVVPASDAFAGPSWLALLSAALARLNAAAVGLPLVRAANGGPSLVTDASGRIRRTLPPYGPGLVEARIAAAAAPSPYARLPLEPGWPLAALAALGIVRNRRPRSRAAPQRTLPALPAALGLPMGLMVLLTFTQTEAAGRALARAGLPAPAGYLFHGHARAAWTVRSPPASGDPLREAYAFLLRRYGVDSPHPPTGRKASGTEDGWHGLMPWQGTPAGWTDAFLPAVLRLRDGEAVVALEIEGKAARVWHPSRGVMDRVPLAALRGPGLALATRPRWWDWLL